MSIPPGNLHLVALRSIETHAHIADARDMDDVDDNGRGRMRCFAWIPPRQDVDPPPSENQGRWEEFPEGGQIPPAAFHRYFNGCVPLSP